MPIVIKMRKSVLAFVGILMFPAGVAGAQDCADFSGVYDLIPSTQRSYFCDGDQTHSPTDCFSFRATTFEISQKGCESAILYVPIWHENEAMTFSEDGREISRTRTSFFREIMTTIRVTDENPRIVNLDYRMRATFFGDWGYPYRYTAQFRRR